MDKNKKAAELEHLIKKYQRSYYSSDAQISDAEFDSLWDELKKIDPQNALLKKIGEDSVDGFQKAKHIMPMGSQEKAANEDEFTTWAQKVELQSFVVQYKLDGISLELQYKNGVLQKAVTRGDGTIGDDITDNARKMQGIVSRLKTNYTGAIRGEVLLFHDVWEKKYSDKANCRNAANGIIHRKEGDGSDDLTLIVYDAFSYQNIESGSESFFKTETDKIKWLEDCGFYVTKTIICKSIHQVIKHRNDTAAMRDTLDFDIDGLVVKDNITDIEDLKRARPQKQIAFKFDLEQALSILRQIEWSESGATYTPIGIIDPVRLAGTTVRRASLCNPGVLRDMGLQIGSQVLVVKRGEIIPKIECVVDADYGGGYCPPSSKRSAFSATPRSTPECAAQNGTNVSLHESGGLSPIEIPSKCGTCGATLIDEGTRLYCPNNLCEKRIFHRLQKWVTVTNIMELGERLIVQLFKNGRVKKIAHLYTLSKDELADFERMGELSAIKVIKNIAAKTELPLTTFIAGLDFDGIGETVMEKIYNAGFDTIEKLYAASAEALTGILGIGEITAQTLVSGLIENKADITELQKYVRILKPYSADGTLKGKSFCFTGELNTMKRTEAQEKVKQLGGIVKTGVVKDLSYLVTNDTESGSAKNKKAGSLGVQIIDEAAFLLLLK
ncbi:MAG: NAD-dependent DNA ligase LigA [Termitinemataceae bacterium]|nr:MAG: NAD-dependent DNA ligase LigA [Termitinemataceae bacterium]